MRLLHPEVEIEPGRRSQQAVAEGVGNGSSVLRLENTSTLENAYVVRVQCDDPYWHADWCTLKAMAAPEVGDQKSSPEPDQYGPHHSWVKVYVPRGGTRDVILDFVLPQNPTARAGAYDLRVVIESFVSGTSRRSARFAEVPLRAVVRPFYKWDIDVSPAEGRRAGRVFRRRRTFEALVTNQSNDWLYCDLHLPRSKDLLLDAPTARVAVPPPEPDEEKLVRSVALRASTKLKLWRGETVVQPLPFTATRVEAPSIGPRDADDDGLMPFNMAPLGQVRELAAPPVAIIGANGYANGQSNGYGARSGSSTSAAPSTVFVPSAPPIGGAVVAHPTADVAQAPADRALHYHPPFPGSLGGLFSGTLSTLRGLILLGVGLVAAWLVASILWESFYRASVIAEPLVAQVAPGGDLTIAGKYLVGSKVYINNNQEAEALKSRPASTTNPLAREILRVVKPGERQYLTIRVDSRYNGQKIRLTVQRAGALSFLSPLLPRYECRTLVQVGLPPAVGPQRALIVGGRYPAGSNFLIRLSAGPDFKAAPKRVTIGAVDAKVAVWKADRILATIPPNCPPGLLLVALTAADGGKATVEGEVEVLAGPTNADATGGASSAGDDTGAGAAGAGGGAGGAGPGGGAGAGGASAAGGGGGGGGGGGQPAPPFPGENGSLPPWQPPPPDESLEAAPGPTAAKPPEQKVPAKKSAVAQPSSSPSSTPTAQPSPTAVAVAGPTATPKPRVYQRSRPQADPEEEAPVRASEPAAPAGSPAPSPRAGLSPAEAEARRQELARAARSLGMDSVPVVGAARRIAPRSTPTPRPTAAPRKPTAPATPAP